MGGLAIIAFLGFMGAMMRYSMSESQADNQLDRQFKLQKDAQRYNSAEADAERDWQEDMYYRHYSIGGKLADARAAGINMHPLFAAGQSVTPAPSGSSASSPVGSASMGSPVDDPFTTMLNLAHGIQGIKESKSVEAKNYAQSDKVQIEMDNLRRDIQLKDIQIKWADIKAETEVAEAKQRINTNFAQMREHLSNINVNNSTISLNGSKIQLNIAQSKLFTAEEQLTLTKDSLSKLDYEKAKLLLPYVQAREEASIYAITAGAKADESRVVYNEQAAINQAEQANLAFVRALNEQGLIDSGYTDKMIKEIEARTSLYNSEGAFFVEAGITEGSKRTKMTNDAINAYLNNVANFVELGVRGYAAASTGGASEVLIPKPGHTPSVPATPYSR